MTRGDNANKTLAGVHGVHNQFQNLSLDDLYKMKKVAGGLVEAEILQRLQIEGRELEIDDELYQMILEGGIENWLKIWELSSADSDPDKYDMFICRVSLYQSWKNGHDGMRRWFGMSEADLLLNDTDDEFEGEWCADDF